MGNDAFGIPEHSPSDGASHLRTPTDGAAQPRGPMPLGAQGAQGGLGARPRDTSFAGLANTANKVKKINPGAQPNLLGDINVNMMGSSLSSLTWPKLPS